jgi:hypothetical protein
MLNPHAGRFDAGLFRRSDELAFIAVFQLNFAGPASYRRIYFGETSGFKEATSPEST